MKKLFMLLPLFLLLSVGVTADPLTKKEREQALQHLMETHQKVLNAASGLSEAQLKFKPSPDAWSIEECLKHIAISEKNLQQMFDGLMQQQPNAAKRSEIKFTDEQVLNMITDRSTKRKTSESFEPANTPFTSTTEAVNFFDEHRKKLIETVTNDSNDYRNRVATLPFGSFDAFQMVLFLSAHTHRHLLQVDEVKAHADFPKA